ncbi:MAG: hypothetical protein JWP89_2303 [Schlesneria sp.]|nr:hypothetical protein [Schlesneria sp.]
MMSSEIEGHNILSSSAGNGDTAETIFGGIVNDRLQILLYRPHTKQQAPETDCSVSRACCQKGLINIRSVCSVCGDFQEPSAVGAVLVMPLPVSQKSLPSLDVAPFDCPLCPVRPW